MTNIINVLKFEEGWKSRPYYCSENYPTIGYGFKLGRKNAPLPEFEISKVVGYAWLSEEVGRISGELHHHKFYSALKRDFCRKAVLESMTYQMGLTGLLKFKKMISAIKNKDFDLASEEMLNSRWAQQTPARAARHAKQMKTGEWSKEYA